MSRAIGIAGLVVACSTGHPRRSAPFALQPGAGNQLYFPFDDHCRIPVLQQAYFANTPHIDCGNLSKDASRRARQTARRCVADATAHQRPFRLYQVEPVVDGMSAHGLIAGPEHGGYAIYALDAVEYTYAPTFPGLSTTIHRCARLDVMDARDEGCAQDAADGPRCFKCRDPIEYQGCENITHMHPDDHGG